MRDKRKELDALASLLLEKEVLFKDDLERLIGKRPFDKGDETTTNPTDASAENVDGQYTVSINTDVFQTIVENHKG